MKRSELKQLVREVIEEDFVAEPSESIIMTFDKEVENNMNTIHQIDSMIEWSNPDSDLVEDLKDEMKKFIWIVNTYVNELSSHQ